MQSQPGRMLQDDALSTALADGAGVILPIAPLDRSMEPTLSGGDAVLAVPLAGEPAPGDLIVFRQQNYLVVHRYLGRARAPDGTPCLRTRGDGRSELDPPVARADVRARVAAVRRRGTWRATEGTPARLYARLVAAHDLFWAGAAHALRPAHLHGAAAALDRALLRAATFAGLAATHPKTVVRGGPDHGVSV